MRKIIFTFFAFFYLLDPKAQQTEKISIAVLPFANAVNNQANYANAIQELVTKEFVKTGRFNVLDRSKFQKVVDELNVQKNEEFLNSKIVEQGKLSGAQYLVTGVINEMTPRKETMTQNTFNSNQPKVNVTVWKYSIRFSYQVIDVATSQSVYSETISAVNNSNHTRSEAEALQNAQCLLKKEVRNAVMKEFPEEIQIVKVEKTTKKGLPDEVLINAGSNFFDNSKKEYDCGENVIVNIFKKKESIKLKAYEIEILNVNGKELKREKEFGQLKLKEVQGEFSICEITSGAKEIQDKLNGNQKILLKIL